MRVRFAGTTDVGRNRTNNEDAYYIASAAPLCMVADGMGGHSAGEVASALALNTLRYIYDDQDDDELALLREGIRIEWPFERRPPEHAEERRLVEAVLLANAIVNRAARDQNEKRGMGTTLVGGYFLETGLYLCNIGDSRGYRLRDGKLERITRDHSLADEYVQMGILREDELDQFPYKNVITRALGLAERVEPSIGFKTISSGDRYLFCTDGLTDPLVDDEIAEILRRDSDDIEALCQQLVDAANDAGGPDNITVVVAEVG